MEKRYIDLIHELQDCETARNFVLARAEAAEADARECRAERARYSDAMTARLADVEAERDALRAALQSLIDGRDEYEIEYFTGMGTTEAREIINLAYNRK